MALDQADIAVLTVIPKELQAAKKALGLGSADKHISENGTHYFVGQASQHEPKIALACIGRSMLDLIRYVGIHLNAWPPRDDPEGDLPVSRATRRESPRPGGFHRVGRNSKGLGWAIERDGAIGDVVHHSGGSPVGYSSFAGFEPDVGIGIAGLANADVDLEKPLLGVLASYAIAHGLIADGRR